MHTTEFDVATDAAPLTCTLASPAPENMAPDPALLLAFGSARQIIMGADPHSTPAELFVQAGHRALGFDLPNHGDLINEHGEGIKGMCAAFLAGDDPFVRFVANGKKVIDACLEKGLARPGKIFICGGSRGGYCALRLGAADLRINGMAGFAPVTDWRLLSEFSAVTERPDVAALALYHWAEDLADRPLYMAIGNHDHRVGTHACVALAQRLFELENPARKGTSAVEIHVVHSSGHALPEEWGREGARFLLRLCEG